MPTSDSDSSGSAPDESEVSRLRASVAELHPAAEDLHAEMVFLVDHDGEGFIGRDRDATRHVGRSLGEVARDQVAFDE